MAVINNISVGRDETKRFRIYRGNVEEISQAQATECSGSNLTIVAFNAVQQRVSGGSAIEFTQTCQAYPGAIIHTVVGSWVWSQPQPISYAISKNNVTLVVGSIGKSESGGGDDGGTSEPEAPADPNFGGEPPVVDPDAAPPPGSPPSLPGGNGNTGFGGVSSAGSQLGITGGNT